MKGLHQAGTIFAYAAVILIFVMCVLTAIGRMRARWECRQFGHLWKRNHLDNLECSRCGTRP